MAKIVHFPSKDKDQIEKLEQVLAQAKAGNIKRFVFAAELNEKDEPEDELNLVATSWDNADIGFRQYLIAHLQADITLGLVSVNFLEE